jgi:hypothetical protein
MTPTHPAGSVNMVEREAEVKLSAGEVSYRQYRATNPDAQPDGTREALEQCARMLEEYIPDAFPANENGQVDFIRCMTDATAAEIRSFLAKTGDPA